MEYFFIGILLQISIVWNASLYGSRFLRRQILLQIFFSFFNTEDSAWSFEAVKRQVLSVIWVKIKRSGHQNFCIELANGCIRKDCFGPYTREWKWVLGISNVKFLAKRLRIRNPCLLFLGWGWGYLILTVNLYVCVCFVLHFRRKKGFELCRIRNSDFQN